MKVKEMTRKGEKIVQRAQGKSGVVLAEDREVEAERRRGMTITFGIYFQQSQRHQLSLCSQRRSSNLEALFQEGGCINAFITYHRFWLQNVESEFIMRSPIRTIFISLAERIKRIQLQNDSNQSKEWWV
jgi:hypothetical protein